ncbi:MAG: polysaccharide biosynthesis tyrosine autokinase [Candidatus Methanomethylicaceae archaeon]
MDLEHHQQPFVPVRATRPTVPQGSQFSGGYAGDMFLPVATPSFAEAIQARTFHDYVQAIWRRRLLIACLTVIGVATGLAFVLPRPLTYGSALTLEIQGISENFMGLSQVDPQASGGIYSANQTNILTQVEILNSGSIKQRAAERLEREIIPRLPPEGSGVSLLFNKLRALVGLAADSPVESTRDAIRAAVSSCRARPVEGTRIVRLSCESTIPEVAAEFLNVLVAEYTEQMLEQRARSSRSTNQWLESQMREQKQKLEEAETRLKDFIARSGLEGLTPQETQSLTLADAKMLALQAELAQMQTDRIVRQSRYETALRSRPEEMPESVASPLLMQLRGQLIELEKQYADLTTTFTEDHPRVIRLRNQMAQVRRAIESEKEEIVNRLKTDLEAARRREQLLQSSFAAQTGQVRSQADKALQYNLLKREVESARQVYNTILQQVNQAGVATAVPTTNVRVVDPAAPSRSANLKNFYLGGGLGAAAGLLFGAIIALLLYQSDSKFQKPGEALSVLQLPELGVIPSGDIFRDRRARLRITYWKGKSAQYTSLGNAQDGSTNVELIRQGDYPTLLAESFRAVVTSLLFSQNIAGCRVVTVTSPNPQDGKSTVVANLAVILAEMGREVIVLDADFRRPKQHVLFRIENTWGLADLLADQTAVGQYSREALCRKTSAHNVFLLPSGSPVKNIAVAIHSERFLELLQRLRSEFDYVLIDTPPVLVVSDARIIGQKSDGVVIVLRAGETLQAEALQAVQRLREDGTKILGTILNQWIPSRRGAKYYKKYYDYYRFTQV